jgi:hypothetical protein
MFHVERQRGGIGRTSRTDRFHVERPPSQHSLSTTRGPLAQSRSPSSAPRQQGTQEDLDVDLQVALPDALVRKRGGYDPSTSALRSCLGSPALQYWPAEHGPAIANSRSLGSTARKNVPRIAGVTTEPLLVTTPPSQRRPIASAEGAASSGALHRRQSALQDPLVRRLQPGRPRGSERRTALHTAWFSPRGPARRAQRGSG